MADALDDLEVGQDIYCPAEGWSGEVVEMVPDEYTGDPAIAIVKDHDPSAAKPWIYVPLSAYQQRADHETWLN